MSLIHPVRAIRQRRARVSVRLGRIFLGKRSGADVALFYRGPAGLPERRR